MTLAEDELEAIRQALLLVNSTVSQSHAWTFNQNKVWGRAYNIVTKAKENAAKEREKGKDQ